MLKILKNQAFRNAKNLYFLSQISIITYLEFSRAMETSFVMRLRLLGVAPFKLTKISTFS